MTHLILNGCFRNLNANRCCALRHRHIPAEGAIVKAKTRSSVSFPLHYMPRPIY